MLKIPKTLYISGGAVSELIISGDGDAALLYLFCTAGGEISGAAKELRWKTERVRAAEAMLAELGLSSGGKKPQAKSESSPTTDKRFYALTQEVQGLFGRPLSSDELVRLFGIYSSLGLPTEVILQLVAYCIAETSGAKGKTSPPSMRYIEKAAYTWDREGISTLEHAERYIKERSDKKRESAKIKAVLQIHDRNLAPTERKYVDGWLALGFTSEAIAIAYDKTVTKTGKLSWGYMNSIINSWHGKGLYSAEDILSKDSRRSGSPRRPSPGLDSPDDKEVERINRILRDLSEEN